MSKGIKFIIFSVLIIGIIYRLILSGGGNFIFNMDNARDMVDVREMVVLKHFRLIGPNSAIEGVFNGPGWYYLLSIPFVFSGGNPYASILMEIMLWALGGWFLLKLVARWGTFSVIMVGSIWIASNFILLSSQYAFNPNPVIFLTPVLIYLLEKYLEKGEKKTSILLFLLTGLFLHFEMAAGIFILPFILVSIFFLNKKLLKGMSLWIGLAAFILTLVPQFLFELKHDFFMTKSMLSYLSSHSANGGTLDLLGRFATVSGSFYDTILPTFMNFKIFTQLSIVLFFWSLFIEFHKGIKKMDRLFLLAALLILVSFLGFIILPITVNRWHLDAVIVAGIISTGYILKSILEYGKLGKLGGIGISVIIVSFSLLNIKNYLLDLKMPSNDPAVFRNEISSIDYVYQKASGKNFKVYVYLPSVVDYPYQYLFWWHGFKKYGYLPEDFAYAPNKPPYISQKELLNRGSHPEGSGQVFLIKQPDQTGIRHLWENTFKPMELLSSENVGPNVIEIRKEASQSGSL